MTQGEKQLLLTDLCGRLPYGVRGQIEADGIISNRFDTEGFPVETTFSVDVELEGIDAGAFEISISAITDNKDLENYIWECQEDSPWKIDEFKPYLRPLSSMTEEEINEFILISDTVLCLGNKRSTCILSLEQMDWLNAHHFDYRGLIPKGLALEASKGMYKEERNESIH